MKNIHKIWEKNAEQIGSLQNEDFILSPVIQETMFCSDLQLFQDEFLELLPGILSEHYNLIQPTETFGCPKLINGIDPNTIHHIYHLNQLLKFIGGVEKLKEIKTIVEFGGGYGNFCRLIKKLNHGCNYTIIDLPELSKLQAFYLKNTLSVEDYETVTFANEANISSIKNCDLFIATWSLSECPQSLQDRLFDSRLFNAKHILCAFHQCGNHIPFMQESTHFMNKILELDVVLVQNELISGKNYYAIK